MTTKSAATGTGFPPQVAVLLQFPEVVAVLVAANDFVKVNSKINKMNKINLTSLAVSLMFILFSLFINNNSLLSIINLALIR